jgi:lysine 6-dehydrogenase
MTRYVVMGAGMMGRVVAADLLASEENARVTLCDANQTLLSNARSELELELDLDADRVQVQCLDAAEASRATEALAGYDVAVAALPHGLSLSLVKAAIEAKTSLVDLVGEAPEARRALDGEAKIAGITVIPGCGVAPGISNFCVGHAMTVLEETMRAVIYVGGIPKRAEPPLYYQTVYLLESVLQAYRRPATIRRDGQWTQVEPLTGLESLDFEEPIGTLEAFFTDGLGSLPITLGEQIGDELYEKTLRYPGHAANIGVLRDSGMLSDEEIEVGSASVAPVRVLQRVLENKLKLSPEGDILVMRVVVEGLVSRRERRHTFELVDHFDAERGHTAMGRTTGFTAACAARAIARGDIPEKGVVFPEEIFTGTRYDSIVSELQTKGVHVVHEEGGDDRGLGSGV